MYSNSTDDPTLHKQVEDTWSNMQGGGPKELKAHENAVINRG